MSSNQNVAEPSLTHGHLQYAKGVVEETIGNVTGSESWKTSGHTDKAQAQAELQAADKLSEESRQANNANRDRKWLEREGKAEEVVGKIGGCGGLQHHGQEKQEASHR
ncbi:uncharacterized protein SPPG_06810 [Spizellomyces punctatus DAOM BR117]|uniref:CsbD-like domain-containing protein n=1 Tax=Spizellomyces punctatus (strain DAOM BR117) TaxID=645134 RepID=A0A0L0H8G1_SPIPD|nr:uncharacterized protein SPPG_06810 [Spizellomyces punctatus DAOM BR117]KNC97815.1 hypothetical protein SPPG_06810 [Spizellomyces punctatus DAOM BR117]|eukprot:XP_016605855.1 hypothetical protein SPPG_06810 [Spizellomyces punctatus DAOM BR117]